MTKSTKAWWVLILSYIALLGSMLLSTFEGAPTTIESESDLVLSGVIFWALKCLPLFLFIPGLIKKSHYAASWLSYAIMLYFVLIIAFGTDGWMWVQSAAMITLFIAAMLFTRWKKAEERA